MSQVRTGFQNELNNMVKDINKDKEVIVPADKTTNFHTLTKTAYNKLLDESITKTYKKCGEEKLEEINHEMYKAVELLGVGQKLESIERKEPFCTIKDHKNNFLL